MNKFCFKHLILFSFLVSAAVTFAEPVKLASVPTPLPNGKQFVFEWNGDIWSSAIKGGKALQLTHHPAKDHWPTVSPDGKQIAFSSKRNDITQVYIMPIGGGTPRQITFHTEGATPLRWFPDGKSLLIRAVRDQVEVGEQSTRFFRVPIDGSGRENLLFNAFGYEADISPDGNKLLFTRDGTKLYRKGYKGSLTAKFGCIILNQRNSRYFAQIPAETDRQCGDLTVRHFILFLRNQAVSMYGKKSCNLAKNVNLPTSRTTPLSYPASPAMAKP